MSTVKTCMHCFSGSIVNGVCNHCRQSEQTQDKRRATALPLQTVLNGRYYIGDVLGSGGFGITYSAWDMQDKKRVAVKELFPSKDVSRLADQRTVRVVDGQESYFQHVSQCFINEANLLIQLKKVPGVVSLYSMFSENETLYYAMEYLEGVNLRDRLDLSGTMTWEQIVPILRAVLQAMEYLHGAGLIHRDISPDNIFLTTDGNARLIDFGSVRTYNGEKRSFTTFMKQNFAPIEQYKSNGDQGPWTDIYALCVTVYYSLTGTLPPSAPDRVMNDTIKPISSLCPQLPQNVAAALHKGMAVNMDDRYKDVRHLVKDMFSSPPPPPPPPPKQLFNIICTSGIHRGEQWSLTQNTRLLIGRQPHCDIRYPQTMTYVSGNHCTIAVDSRGAIMVRDDMSRNGTWLENTQMRGGTWYMAARGCRIRFAQEEYLIQ